MVTSGSVDSDLNTSKTNLTNFATTFESLSGSWQGASFDGISSQVSSFASEAISLISSQMSSFSAACGLVPSYEETKKNLAAARASYNAAKKEDKYKYTGRISQLENQLQQLKSEIEGLLASISGTIDSSSSTGSVSVDVDTSTSSSAFGLGSTTSSNPTGKLSFGSFEKHVYTASDGTKIDYMLYKPYYDGKEASGLAMHVYLTGAGMRNTGDSIMTYNGVGKNLKNRTQTPSNMVMIPHVVNGRQYESEKFRNLLAEMAVNVTKENNGDTNRISLGGHSYGAITAYRIVDTHPNTFSAIVPVSGSAKISNTDSFKNIKIWAFHGTRDNPGNNTDYKQVVKVMQQLQSAGVNATLHAYSDYPNCFHTHTADTTYSNEFESPEGETINPIEWAFKQKTKA